MAQLNPFDVVNSINEKTKFEFDIKDYPSWLVNKAFSNNLDTVFYADMMNRFSHLSKQAQYDFYKVIVPKAKRRGQWHKKDTINNDMIELLCVHYQCNKSLAAVYLKLLSDDDKQHLMDKADKGGK